MVLCKYGVLTQYMYWKLAEVCPYVIKQSGSHVQNKHYNFYLAKHIGRLGLGCCSLALCFDISHKIIHNKYDSNKIGCAMWT